MSTVEMCQRHKWLKEYNNYFMSEPECIDTYIIVACVDFSWETITIDIIKWVEHSDL